MTESQSPLVNWYLSWRRGDRASGGVLYAAAFQPLRTIAARLLARERFGHTLQPTALVNEFFIRLSGGATIQIKDEHHFYNAAARTMGQVLIDCARRKRATKRVLPEAIPVLLGTFDRGSQSNLDLKLALEKLERLDPSVADTLWLCYAEGMTLDEIASLHGVERWRVRERCAFGKQWLADTLTHQARSS